MNYLRTKAASIFTWGLSLLNRGQLRSVKAKKNILASFVIKGLNIGISLLLVPLTIDYVNSTRYGIWLTLSSIIGWFALFDIGLGHGLRNKFAEAMAKGKIKLARIYLSTTYAIMTIIVAALLLVFLCINPFLDWSKILNSPAGMAGELSILSLIVFTFFCLQFVLNLLTTIITANQEPAKASLLNLLGSAISLLIIYLLTLTTKGSLIYLALVFGMAPVLVLFISSIWLYNGKYKAYSPSFKYVRFKFSKGLMNLGLKFFVIQIAALVMYSTDNIIITQLFGPEQVTPYNIAFKYFNLVPMLMGIIITPFWSAYTEAWVKKDLIWIRKTVNKLKLVWAAMTVLTIVMLIFSDFFYWLWVGPEIKVPRIVSIFLAIYVIIFVWTDIFVPFLNGVGKIKLQLYLSIIGMVINIPLALFLGKLIGIGGIILSTILLNLVHIIVQPIQTYKLINNTAKGIWNE